MTLSAEPTNQTEEAAGQSAIPDALVAYLDGKLPDLIASVLADDAEMNHDIEKSELDPSAVIASVRERSEEALRATNPEISQLREAQTMLASYQKHPGGRLVGWIEDLRQKRKFGAVSVGLWIIATWPVAVWQVWPWLSSELGGNWASLLLGCGFIIAPTAAIAFFMAPPGLQRRSEAVGNAAFLAAAIDVLVVYGLLVWRLNGPFAHDIGPGWALAVWVISGCVIGLLGLAFTLSGFLEAPEHWAGGALASLVAWTTAVIVWIITDDYLVSHKKSAILAGHLGAVVGIGLGLTASAAYPLVLGSLRFITRSLVLSVSPSTERPGARGWLRRKRDLEQAAKDRERLWTEAASEAIRTLMLEQIQLMSVPPFSTVKEKISPRGLRLMRNDDDVIETPAFGQLRSLINALDAGAIGMAGPRGTGKSTLLEYYRSGRLSAAGKEQIMLLESVPVRYDAREYALYLYASLCEQVSKFRLKTSAGESPSTARISRSARRKRPQIVMLVSWVLIAYLVLVSAIGPSVHITWIHRLWWLPAAILILGTLTYLFSNRPYDVDFQATAEVITDLPALQRHADWKLRSLRYQLSQTTGWSGAVNLPLGIQGGSSATLEVATQPMTYPEVVNDFKRFLNLVVKVLQGDTGISSIPVAIILDELDKIDAAERVQEFLNEVKALFALNKPGCLFLVSVSEEALARFDRRGLSVRDAFDSTFDTILRVDYLNLADAMLVVRNRGARLPDPFICLGYCLSGGLPRELIRYVRDIVKCDDGIWLRSPRIWSK